MSTQAELREAGNPESDQMAMRVMKFRAWQKALRAADDEPTLDKLAGGISPGGVATTLGVSRQAVHQAIHRNLLDALLVKDDRDGETMFILVTTESLRAHMARREQRKQLTA